LVYGYIKQFIPNRIYLVLCATEVNGSDFLKRDKEGVEFLMIIDINISQAASFSLFKMLNASAGDFPSNVE
jgi:hypothetical protein